MPITPNDILDKEFGRTLRGYNPDEVDDFLEAVADSLAQAIKERNLLRERVQGLEDELKTLKEEEKEIKRMLLSAQRLIDELKAQAEKEAEIIIEEAKAKGEAILEKARQEEERLKYALSELKRKKTAWTSELRATLKKYLEMLEKEPEFMETPEGPGSDSRVPQRDRGIQEDLDLKAIEGLIEEDGFDM